MLLKKEPVVLFPPEPAFIRSLVKERSSNAQVH